MLSLAQKFTVHLRMIRFHRQFKPPLLLCNHQVEFALFFFVQLRRATFLSKNLTSFYLNIGQHVSCLPENRFFEETKTIEINDRKENGINGM